MWHDELTQLTPAPQSYRRSAEVLPLPEDITVFAGGCDGWESSLLWRQLHDDLASLWDRELTLVDSAADSWIEIILDSNGLGADLPPEGYSLVVANDGVRLVAGDQPGLQHGIQTLSQLGIIGQAGPHLGHCRIIDWPVYRHRWLMPDLGRSVWTLELLKRLVRIAARLKYNGLHLHLHDNELNPVIYADTPLGMENPCALPLADYAELIDYAATYHIEIIPELESWGHAGSILQHYPHLYGASRPNGYGHSFGIGPETFDLLGEIFDQWCEILPDNSRVHLGLDEASWHLLDGAAPEAYNPQTLVPILYNLLQEKAEEYGKGMRMIMWGGGSKHPDVCIPPELRPEITLEPWNYRTREDVSRMLMPLWRRDSKLYTEDGRCTAPFIGGGGASGLQDLFSIDATQAFAYVPRDWENCLGLDVTLWSTNDLVNRLLTIWVSAHSAWNPAQAESLLYDGDIDRDSRIGRFAAQMKVWMGAFADTDPGAIQADRGDEVVHGAYRFGPNHGDRVAPLWMPRETRTTKVLRR